MGKMILAICIALLLAAGGCLWCRMQVDAAAGGALAHAQAALNHFSQGQTDAALSDIRQARAHWQAHDSALRLFLRHEKIDAAADSMDRCEYALLYDDPEAFFTQCLALARMLSGLMEGERLTIQNLF